MLPLIVLLFLLSSEALADFDRKVLLISMDGFRYDLLNQTLVPHIHKFANERSAWFVNGVQSQMLTVTAANHMSIVSGLREDEHGIVGNYFWDRQKKEMYDKFHIAGGSDIRDRSEKSDWNPIDPIWLLNQKYGGKSTVINWPAGDYERSEKAGVNMTRYRASFGDISNWPNELNMVVHSLATNNLLLWYIAEPDSTLHGHGFNDGKLQKTLTQLDALFDSLIKKMEERGLMNTTDIILTADHGHIQVQPSKTLCVNRALGDHFINDPEYHAGDSNIYHTNRTIVLEMFKQLRAFVSANDLPYRVHLQKDITPVWHYVNAVRTGDIVIEPLFGGQVKMKCNDNFDDSHSSSHGQDPNLKEMRALLVMSGPSFKAGAKITEVPENIDLFPLVIRLLNIAKQNNSGNLEHLNGAILQLPDDNGGEAMKPMSIALVLCLVLIMQ